MADDFIQIQVTFGDRAEAESVARTLVEKFQVACAQVEGPIQSFYRWNGQFEAATEWLLLAKTRKCLFDEVAETIHAGHSYEVPQIVAVELAAVSPDYEKWLTEQIQ